MELIIFYNFFNLHLFIVKHKQKLFITLHSLSRSLPPSSPCSEALRGKISFYLHGFKAKAKLKQPTTEDTEDLEKVKRSNLLLHLYLRVLNNILV